ncbi:MAG: ABC transporter ATP-binding protein [Candidatus Aminicenantales bacterium]
MRSVCLEVRHVSKRFSGGSQRKGARTVLKDISFELGKGETFGILGGSGTGKTTLGKIIAGILRPTSGKVLFHGQDIHRIRGPARTHCKRKIQMMFQDPEGSLNPKKTLRRSLEDVCHLMRMDPKIIRTKIEILLRTVGLSAEILERYPDQVSGGENQRVALARILLVEPEIIVLDEPTSALDLSVQAQILHLLKKIQEEKDLCYVFISHDLEVVRFMCHDVGIIQGGRLIRSVDVPKGSDPGPLA